jgi:hypothetical protein
VRSRAPLTSNSAMKLTPFERDSSAWQRVAAHAEDRLAKYRAIAENPQQSEEIRLGAAWRISELKELLKLAEPAKEQPEAAG